VALTVKDIKNQVDLIKRFAPPGPFRFYYNTGPLSDPQQSQKMSVTKITLDLNKALRIIEYYIGDLSFSTFSKPIDLLDYNKNMDVEFQHNNRVPQSFQVKVSENYDITNEEHLMLLREGLWQKYFQAAYAIIVTEVFGDLSAAENVKTLGVVNSGTAGVSPACFREWTQARLTPGSGTASSPVDRLKTAIERMKTRIAFLTDKAASLWKPVDKGGRLCFKPMEPPNPTDWEMYGEYKQFWGKKDHGEIDFLSDLERSRLSNLFEQSFSQTVKVGVKGLIGYLREFSGGADHVVEEYLTETPQYRLEKDLGDNFMEVEIPYAAYFETRRSYTSISIREDILSNPTKIVDQNNAAGLGRNLWWVIIHELLHSFPIYTNEGPTKAEKALIEKSARMEYEKISPNKSEETYREVYWRKYLKASGEYGYQIVSPDEDVWTFLYDDAGHPIDWPDWFEPPETQKEKAESPGIPWGASHYDQY